MKFTYVEHPLVQPTSDVPYCSTSPRTTSSAASTSIDCSARPSCQAVTADRGLATPPICDLHPRGPSSTPSPISAFTNIFPTADPPAFNRLANRCSKSLMRSKSIGAAGDAGDAGVSAGAVGIGSAGLGMSSAFKLPFAFNRPAPSVCRAPEPKTGRS